jgi:type I restriction enzyme, R subunit
LADNQSAVDVLGNDQLKIIAHELLKGLKANASIDWAHRDSARARLRVLVKRILRKFHYPPDLEDAAVRGVLAQAEALLSTGDISCDQAFSLLGMMGRSGKGLQWAESRL